MAAFVLKREFGGCLLPHEVQDGCATQATSGLQPAVLWRSVQALPDLV